MGQVVNPVKVGSHIQGQKHYLPEEKFHKFILRTVNYHFKSMEVQETEALTKAL